MVITIHIYRNQRLNSVYMDQGVVPPYAKKSDAIQKTLRRPQHDTFPLSTLLVLVKENPTPLYSSCFEVVPELLHVHLSVAGRQRRQTAVAGGENASSRRSMSEGTKRNGRTSISGRCLGSYCTRTINRCGIRWPLPKRISRELN